MNTISTAAYLQQLSISEYPFTGLGEGTNAAVAAKLSKGLATVIVETRTRKTRMKTLMTCNCARLVPTASRIHRGAMSIKAPHIVTTAVMNFSMRTSLW